MSIAPPETSFGSRVTSWPEEPSHAYSPELFPATQKNFFTPTLKDAAALLAQQLSYLGGILSILGKNGFEGNFSGSLGNSQFTSQVYGEQNLPWRVLKVGTKKFVRMTGRRSSRYPAKISGEFLKRCLENPAQRRKWQKLDLGP